MVAVEARGCALKRPHLLLACMYYVYVQHFSLAEVSLVTCGLLVWKYGNSHCL